MEDHPVMFVILAVVLLLKFTWYMVKIIWLILGLIIVLIKKIFKINVNRNSEGVNNNYANR